MNSRNYLMEKQRIKLTINGLPKDFDAPLNLYDVLEQEEVIEMMIAVVVTWIRSLAP